MPIDRAEITARRKVVLADWVAWGHKEETIRALVKSGPWIESKQEKAKK